MKKLPVWYRNGIIGYIDDILTDFDGNVEYLRILFFKSDITTDAIEGIKKSSFLTLDKRPDKQNIENNTLYRFELDGDTLTVKKQKYENI